VTVNEQQSKSRLAKWAVLLRKGCYRDDGPKPSQFQVKQRVVPTEWEFSVDVRKLWKAGCMKNVRGQCWNRCPEALWDLQRISRHGKTVPGLTTGSSPAF